MPGRCIRRPAVALRGGALVLSWRAARRRDEIRSVASGWPRRRYVCETTYAVRSLDPSGAESMSRVAVVLPLNRGVRARAEALLAHGPPFDPAAAGLERHEVLVTDEEVIFLFAAPEQHLLDRLAR